LRIPVWIPLILPRWERDALRPDKVGNSHIDLLSCQIRWGAESHNPIPGLRGANDIEIGIKQLHNYRLDALTLRRDHAIPVTIYENQNPDPREAR
jgi:hypothetical protein